MCRCKRAPTRQGIRLPERGNWRSGLWGRRPWRSAKIASSSELRRLPALYASRVRGIGFSPAFPTNPAIGISPLPRPIFANRPPQHMEQPIRGIKEPAEILSHQKLIARFGASRKGKHLPLGPASVLQASGRCPRSRRSPAPSGAPSESRPHRAPRTGSRSQPHRRSGRSQPQAGRSAPRTRIAMAGRRRAHPAAWRSPGVPPARRRSATHWGAGPSRAMHRG